MIDSINKATIAAYVTILTFCQTAKQDISNCITDDERGVSGIVVAVLLILVAVLGVMALWTRMSTWISSTFQKVTNSTQNTNPGVFSSTP